MWRRCRRLDTWSGAAAAEQVFRYPFREPDHPIDPTKGATLFNGHYLANLSDGLAEVGPDSHITMLGATEYKVSSVKWSDGTPVTTHDYEFAWKRGLDLSHFEIKFICHRIEMMQEMIEAYAHHVLPEFR